MEIYGFGAESRPAWTRMVRFRSFAFHAFQQDSNYSNHDSEPSSECRQYLVLKLGGWYNRWWWGKAGCVVCGVWCVV